jgi:hypothetical protein
VKSDLTSIFWVEDALFICGCFIGNELRAEVEQLYFILWETKTLLSHKWNLFSKLRPAAYNIPSYPIVNEVSLVWFISFDSNQKDLQKYFCSSSWGCYFSKTLFSRIFKSIMFFS